MAQIVVRVDCLDYEKGCWRVFRVGEETDLLRLSFAVLASFGADGSHMMEMRTQKERFVMFGEDLEEGGGAFRIGRGLPDEGFEVSLLEETAAGEVMGEGEKLRLLYDFSAGHEFLFTVLSRKEEGGGEEFRVLDGEGRGILEETGPQEERRAMEARLSGMGCVLKDALGREWDPLDVGEGLDTGKVIGKAGRMTADFYAED